MAAIRHIKTKVQFVTMSPEQEKAAMEALRNFVEARVAHALRRRSENGSDLTAPDHEKNSDDIAASGQ